MCGRVPEVATSPDVHHRQAPQTPAHRQDHPTTKSFLASLNQIINTLAGLCNGRAPRTLLAAAAQTSTRSYTEINLQHYICGLPQLSWRPLNCTPGLSTPNTALNTLQQSVALPQPPNNTPVVTTATLQPSHVNLISRHRLKSGSLTLVGRSQRRTRATLPAVTSQPTAHLHRAPLFRHCLPTLAPPSVQTLPAPAAKSHPTINPRRSKDW